jgi:hypothetical protein
MALYLFQWIFAPIYIDRYVKKTIGDYFKCPFAITENTIYGA